MTAKNLNEIRMNLLNAGLSVSIEEAEGMVADGLFIRFLPEGLAMFIDNNEVRFWAVTY